MNIRIEKAKEQDLYDIQKMCQSLVEYEYNKFNDKVFSLNWAMSENGKEHFQDLITNGLVYIARLGEKSVGYIAGEIEEKNECNAEKVSIIENLYISDECRGMGAGSLLINKFIETCKRNNIKYIKVNALYNNKQAINFYEKNKFRKYDTTLIYEIDASCAENELDTYMSRRIIVSTLIKCKDKYLFIKQNKEGGAYQDCLHIVGGGIENNETPEEAIKREVMEEVHIQLETVTPFDFDSDILMYKGEMTQLIFLRFTAEIEEFTGYADSDAKEMVWLKKEEILNYKHNEPSIRFLKKLGLI